MVDRIMPRLSHIFIYPIKSLDGVSVAQTRILSGGSLEHDREFVIVDQQGKWVNGKRTAAVHQLRSQFHLSARIVTLSVQGKNPVSFHLDHARSAIAAWLSDFFGFAVELQQNTVTGFPDDPTSPGPTLISTASIEQVASWFPDVSFEEMRTRLRTNLEITDVPAFWEERLYAETDQPIEFQLGAVKIQGINPCQRCVVPTRDSISGVTTTQFQKTFVAKRKEDLPTWAPASRFNHFYRLAVNTRIDSSEAGKSLRVGDAIETLLTD